VALPEERQRRGLNGPAIAVITGLRKRRMTTFTEADYRTVRRLGVECLATTPRGLVE
jgi:hypothetical protein